MTCDSINILSETEESSWKVPMSTSKKRLTNKKIDMQLLGALTLQSKFDPILNKGERYLYQNSLDKSIVCDLTKKSVSTVNRNLSKLINAECNIINVINTDNGIVYQINYQTNGKEYVTIHSDMLEELIKSTNSNVIKVYVLMVYHLKLGRKQMTFEYIGNEIGLSGHSGKNRSAVATMIKSLAKLGFIKIYEIDTPKKIWSSTFKRDIVSSVKGYEYELSTYSEWLKTNYSIINNNQRK